MTEKYSYLKDDKRSKSFVDTLKKNCIFKGLDPVKFAEVVRSARKINKGKNGTFFRRHHDATRFYILLKGRVKMTQLSPTGHQITVRYAGAGDIFGGGPLFDDAEYPATATAVIDSEALYWDRAATHDMIHKYPRIALNVIDFIRQELNVMRQRYLELATQRVEQRIARTLLRLVQQSGTKADKGILIDFPLSRQDLADLTGTTLHTVSRVLSKWEDRGWIESGRKRILIKQPHKIVTVSDDLNA